MPESPAPAFVRINYHSVYGPHTMQVPTLAFAAGDFETWAGGSVSAATMIGDMVDFLLPFYPDTTVFDNYIVFSQPTPADDPLPVDGGVFVSVEGTAATPGWTKATQLTMSIRSTLFGISKIVFLDAASGNNWDPIRSPDASMTALLAELSDLSNGWAARDNGRPNTFVGLTKTLNEKLRKAYRMA